MNALSLTGSGGSTDPSLRRWSPRVSPGTGGWNRRDGYQKTLDAWRRATAVALDESEECFYAEWEASAETRFRAVWEGTAEAIILTDPDGIVLAVNPAYCTLYGCTPQTRIGHSFALIFPEAERAEAEANYHAFFTDPDPPRTYEARVQRPDGSKRIVEAHCDFVVRDGERVAMLSVIRDITEATRRERAHRDFVAMASHDLASPLRVLRARAKLLQHQQRYDEASVVAILQQTERLERVLTELRERVLLEGDGLVLQRETVDLVTLAADAVGRAGLLPTAQTVRLDVPEEPVVVVGDRDRLGQVLDTPPRQRDQVLTRWWRDRGPGCERQPRSTSARDRPGGGDSRLGAPALIRADVPKV